MAHAHAPRVVAVLDSDPDTTEMLKTWLEFNGLVVATGNLTDFRLGKANLLEFLQRTAPDIVVYDLGPPYETNFEYLRRMRADPAFPPCSVVVTTTNARVVESLFGIQAIEILGKPYDLAALVRAILGNGAVPHDGAGHGHGAAPGHAAMHGIDAELPDLDGQPADADRRRYDRRNGERRIGERRHGDGIH